MRDYIIEIKMRGTLGDRRTARRIITVWASDHAEAMSKAISRLPNHTDITIKAQRI